ncbi:MAG: hypothetical protein J0I21_08660 [Alphaproteobacteria bacterium]|nr:hypothetical protein [Alphaproteobacteria bacterium]
MSIFITKSELADNTDIELRSKFCSLLNELHRLEGQAVRAYQVRASVEAVREELADRRVKKPYPKPPGF